MTSRRIHVGRDVRLVGESDEGVDLEGVTRLRPGETVELVRPDPAGRPQPGRKAEVYTWFVVRVGSDGPMFAGHCIWQ